VKGILWRTIYAVIAVVLLFALIPLLFGLVGFPLAGNLWAILRICIAGLAVYYVLGGPSPPAPF
jgi:hypothetical protein